MSHPLLCSCGVMPKLRINQAETVAFCNTCGFGRVLARDFVKVNHEFLDQGNNWEATLIFLLERMRGYIEETSKDTIPRQAHEKEKQELLNKIIFLRGLCLGAQGFKRKDLK